MTKWAPARDDTIGALADEILHNYAHGRVVIAIDGPDGAGKSRFADDLARVMGERGAAAFRASIDDFHHPYAEATRAGEFDPAGWYENAYDYDLLKTALISPFRSGGSFVTAAFDSAEDIPRTLAALTAPDDAILIVDGVFLNREELRGLWNYSVYLDVDADVALARYSERDGTSPDADAPLNQRYLGAQALYVAEARPRTTATAIINNADYEHPRRNFADSC
ncbi:uridine kinase [Glaciihabitans sp. dw_435]|uniref:uridine kinase n=1 Tax=Glaciihabitans sp. dw_435 TaxID=2720081 RepID=UPI001BD69AC4|nr:uridine kinase [Glaciihabitans sp. dw_435]